MDKIILKGSEVFRKGAEAWKAGTLQPPGTCMYRDQDGRPCIIGASMTPEQGIWLEDEWASTTIWDIGQMHDVIQVIEDVPGFGLERLSDLQSKFDAANRGPETVSDLEAFLHDGITEIEAFEGNVPA